MTADGSIIIDTRIDTDSFIDIKKQFTGLASSAKKLGVTIAAAFSVRAVINFAKSCLDLGSDLQEVQNVVDVTFTTMNQQVNEFAKNAVTTAGLSETMAKRYVGTFGAMSKAFGFAESEAYSMATALTQLSGDVASFYNLSQDEAYTKLKSVFTGETESLKDLGVVMTQTALDSYALANGYSKTTAAMSEQEKVALRYAFVLDQLSAASGDFTRTADSWANQVRVLSLQFDQLKATIGQGLINVLTPVVKVINTLLTGLQSVATAFSQLTSILFGDAGDVQDQISGIADGYESAAESAGDLATNTSNASEAAEKSLAGFDEISKLSSDTDSSSGSSDSSGGISGISGLTSGTIATGINLEDNLSPQVEAMANKVQELIAPLQEISFEPLKTSLVNLGTEFLEFGGIIGDALEWAWFNILVPLAQWTIEDAAPAAVDLLASALSVLNEILIALQPLGVWLWEKFLEPIANWAGGTIITVIDLVAKALDKISKWISDNQALVEGITIAILSFMAAWKVVKLATIISGIVSAIVAFIASGGLATAVVSALAAAIAFLTSPITLTVVAIGALITAIVLLIKNWDSVKKTALDVWNKIKSIWGDVSNWFKTKVLTPLKDNFQKAVQNIQNGWKNAWNSVKSATTSIWSGIKSKIQNFVNLIRTAISFTSVVTAVKNCWNKIKASTTSIWSGIKSTIKGSINGIIGFINGMISGLVSGINSAITALNKLSVNIPDWVPSVGGKTFGFNINTISAPKIPYLATGAVIPPNAPFAAVLGDQKHGTNIEAPLDTIKQALAEVMAELGGMSGGDININFTGELSALARVLKPYIDRENRRVGGNLVKGGTV